MKDTAWIKQGDPPEPDPTDDDNAEDLTGDPEPGSEDGQPKPPQS